jgi:hypothetical protein
MLRSEFKIEDESEDLAAAVAKASAAAAKAQKIKAMGVAGEEMTAEQLSLATAAVKEEEEEALLEAERMAKAAPDPTSGGSGIATDSLPGNWVETIVDVARTQKVSNPSIIHAALLYCARCLKRIRTFPRLSTYFLVVP